MVLNKKSKPVIRALKTELTNNINEKGVMDMSAMMNIKDLYLVGIWKQLLHFLDNRLDLSMKSSL